MTRISSAEDYYKDTDELILVEHPRKITLFRCVLEKQLGIDWEHDDSASNELFNSIQTDMMRDGYANALKSEWSESYRDPSSFKEMTSQLKDTQNNLMMSRKRSTI